MNGGEFIQSHHVIDDHNMCRCFGDSLARFGESRLGIVQRGRVGRFGGVVGGNVGHLRYDNAPSGDLISHLTTNTTQIKSRKQPF